jgi:curved DNA-binding protein CbpA
MPYKSQYATPYQCLGIASTATESEIRTAYRALALEFHPDKAPSSEREEATSKFQELNAAYEVCLKRLSSPKAGYVDEWDYDFDGDNATSHWRDNLAPAEQPVTGQEWWDELTEDDPLPLREWGKACKKALRNSRLKMTETERVILNWEYQEAYARYEAWRRKEEAQVEAQKAQWRQEAELNEREYRNMMFFREKKKEVEGDGTEYDAYVEDLDEEQYFEHDEGSTEVPTGTWRDNTPNKPLNKTLQADNTQRLKTAVKELENFRRQIQALEEREERQPLKNPTQRQIAGMKWKAEVRKATMAKLQLAVKKEEKQVFEDKVGKKLAIAEREARRKGMELDYRDVEGVKDERLFEEAFIRADMTAHFLEGAEKAEIKAIEEIPDSWEDDCEE